ncbi:MAG: hypothetical protein BWK75_04850 [Candidatus Altiarchaeales archaeon A3]|nr:MAG: hypothetical protein BWK75_04850 [Candidatus Altiarchaeales archaeon A3]
MLLITTPNIEGKRIVKYLGIVSGETIVGINVFKDIGALIRNVIGGRVSGYEKELIKAKDIAIDEMSKRAEDLGANAVIGIDLNYESLGQGGMLMICASGTAVIIEE